MANSGKPPKYSKEWYRARELHRRKQLIALLVLLLLVIGLLALLVKGIIWLAGLGRGKEETVQNSMSLAVEQIEEKISLAEEAEIQTEAEEPSQEEMLAWIDAHESLYPENETVACRDKPGLIRFLYYYGRGEYTISNEISYTREELDQNVPELYQWDDRWGYHPYGQNVVGISGCGPTCMAMAVLGLTGDTSVTPVSMADFAMNNGYYYEGTSWEFIPAAAAANGVTCTAIPLVESSMAAEVEAGHVLVLSVAPGHFTTVGHFILITGYENGMFRVNDPNNPDNSKLWALSTFMDEIQALWSLSY